MLPLLLPALGGQLPLAAALDQFDGVLLTGSLSNVEPQHYAGAASRPGTLHDPARDATTLPLIGEVIARGMPLLGICRGFQRDQRRLGRYAASACAGTSRPGRPPGFIRRRAAGGQLRAGAPGAAAPGSLLAQALGVDEIQVNSLHQQGVATWPRPARRGARAGWADRSLQPARCTGLAARGAMAPGMAVCTQPGFAGAVYRVWRSLSAIPAGPHRSASVAHPQGEAR